MSETYYFVEQITKREYSNFYKKEFKKDNVKIENIFGMISIIFCGLFYLFNNKMLANIFLAITAACYLVLIIKDNKSKSNDEICLPKELVFQICINLRELDLYSLAIIEEMQNEIQKEIKKREEAINRFSKRISVLFVSLFWIPAGFLTKYLFDRTLDSLNWNDYREIIVNLLVITVMIIGMYFSIHTIIESVSRYNIHSLNLVNRYLYDTLIVKLS
ncbi:hypothetical protein ACFC9R_13665 [Enterococcus casseliflavus]